MNESMKKFMSPEFVASLEKQQQEDEHREVLKLIVKGIESVLSNTSDEASVGDTVMITAASVAFLRLSFIERGWLTAQEFDDKFMHSVNLSYICMLQHNK